METPKSMEGGNTEKPVLNTPQLHETTSSDVKTVSGNVLKRRSLAGRLMRGVLGLLTIGAPAAADTAININQATAQTFSKQLPTHTLEQTTPLHKSIAEDVEFVKSLPQVEASVSLTDTLKAPLVVDRSKVEQNPINIVAEADVVGSNGDLIQQFTVLDNSVPYEMHLDGDVYTARNALTAVPMGNVQSLATIDGRTLIAGGQIAKATIAGKVFLSPDAGKRWVDKTDKFPSDLQGATQMMRLTGNTFILTNSKFEGGSNQVLFDVENGEIINVRTIKYTDGNGNPVAIGRAKQMSLMSFDQDSGLATIMSTGSTQLLEGLLILKVDSKAGTGVVRQITQVTAAGQTNLVRLGYLWGAAFYSDNGQPHVKTLNDTLQTAFDVNLTTLNATEFYYGNLLDDRGIADYNPGSLHLEDLRVDTDAAGNRWTRVAGLAGSSKIGSRAIALTLEKPEDFIDLFPTVSSNIGQGGMQRKQIRGQMVEDFTIFNAGKAILLPDGRLLFTDGGFPGKITARAYLPALSRQSSGW